MRILMFILGVIIGMSTGLAGAQSLPPAPVEAHWTRENVLYMYDCYPLPWPGEDTAETLTVYIAYTDGLVGYGCKVGQVSRISPLSPPGYKMAYGGIH